MIYESNGLKWIVRKESLFRNVLQDNLGPARREIEVLTFLKENADPTKVFVDVGAALGGFSLRLAKYYRLVVAIEPFPFFFKGLEENIKLNKIGNIRAMNIACLDKRGKLWFFKDFKTGLGFVGFRDRKSPEMIEIESYPLDDLALEGVGAIKIDTEGWESAILRGGKKLIMRDKPVLAIESHEKTYKIKGETKKITNFLDEIGYKWRIALF